MDLDRKLINVVAQAGEQTREPLLCNLIPEPDFASRKSPL